ncbi:MAG TPA: MauE/DoxX family redox-associated membrane protein [Bacteroidia bacterium]|nr:MauE/DoxX family redox-associated membrane protein [Bacteroidia bacterium]
MGKIPRWKISLYAMVALYIGGGINHFINPSFYLSVMPAWLPYQEFANYSSGVVEIILGILLLVERTRRFSAWMIIAMLSVFFFVIHIPMCFHFYGKDTMMFWISVARIPLQIVLINWAWKFAKRRHSSPATSHD